MCGSLCALYPVWGGSCGCFLACTLVLTCLSQFSLVGVQLGRFSAIPSGTICYFGLFFSGQILGGVDSLTGAARLEPGTVPEDRLG